MSGSAQGVEYGSTVRQIGYSGTPLARKLGITAGARVVAVALKNNPSFFWYFNNGITAITQSLPKKVNSIATQIDITGLQIINGAQTFYAIYKAYQEAKNGEKHIMNESVLITFRLVRGGNKDFELDITRYTNQQNVTEPRDFWANDPVQIRLQNESFNTDYWYEIRRSEFRRRPKTIDVFNSTDFIHAYLCFCLEMPHYVGDSRIFETSANRKKGLYEYIFNPETHFEDMLMSYRLHHLFSPKSRTINPESALLFGLFKTVFGKLKTGDIPFTKAINLLLDKEEGRAYLVKIHQYISLKYNETIRKHPLFPQKDSFEIKFNTAKDYFENIPITKAEIEIPH